MLYLARYPQLRGAERYPLLLPANGVGTLRGLRRGMAKGVVHAKTGTLDRVATLAGYLGRPDGVLSGALETQMGGTSNRAEETEDAAQVLR
jgi:D-alanyl-D-alanine carboxypeptidase